jgi:hypothetical protein
VHEFINLSALGIGLSGTLSKNDVTNRVEARIRAASINEFPMPTTFLANE